MGEHFPAITCVEVSARVSAFGNRPKQHRQPVQSHMDSINRLDNGVVHLLVIDAQAVHANTLSFLENGHRPACRG